MVNLILAGIDSILTIVSELSNPQKQMQVLSAYMGKFGDRVETLCNPNSLFQRNKGMNHTGSALSNYKEQVLIFVAEDITSGDL